MSMQLRNRLLALACLILFITLGVLIFLSKGSAKPFAVILFVADNVNPSCLTASRIYAGGGGGRLQLEEFPRTALCRNCSSDHSVPDAASAATAISGGVRVPNGRLCLDASGARIPSLLEEAALRGRATGLISTGGLYAPSAAAFYAKSADPADCGDLAAQFRNHPPFDVVMACLRERELTEDSLPKETKLVRTSAELESFPFWKRTPVAAQLSDSPPANPVALSDLVRIAIRRLQLNGKGYLLVVDDPSIGAAAASNDGESMLRKITELDRAVATARRYAGEDAMIVVTGRENIGGFQLNGSPFLNDKGVAVVALDNRGYPSMCWSTGPGFAMDKPSDPAAVRNPSREARDAKTGPGILTQPTAFFLPQGIPNAGDVVAAGIGEGTERIHGFLDLTDIHRIVRDSL